MRAALRPLVVGMAVLGLAAAGATTAAANGHPAPSHTTHTSWAVEWTDNSTDIHHAIVFGPMLNRDNDVHVGNN